ncbi:MAG: hypothetical protein NT029_03380 [Armatimonadetes bacterium]|nr:hypothetical protein [Armatimonadota bacterium]
MNGWSMGWDLDASHRRARTWQRRLMQPGEYGAAVWHLSQRLETLVGWQALCDLACARSVAAWLVELPTEVGSAAHRMLE